MTGDYEQEWVQVQEEERGKEEDLDWCAPLTGSGHGCGSGSGSAALSGTLYRVRERNGKMGGEGR